MPLNIEIKKPNQFSCMFVLVVSIIKKLRLLKENYFVENFKCF